MAAGNPSPPEDVRAMFDRIAPVYEAMNTIMTAGIDARWRRAATRAAALRPGMRVLDVACGTGQLTRAAGAQVVPGGEAIGVDFSPRMVELAATRDSHGAVRHVVGDALALPFPDASFDAALVGFGLRNMADYRAALAEMVRVVREGGRVVVLELGVPVGQPARTLYLTWFRRVVPLLGRLVRRRGAYRYLPESVGGYPSPERIAELMREVGLRDVRWRRLTGGFVTLHHGVRARRGRPRPGRGLDQEDPDVPRDVADDE